MNILQAEVVDNKLIVAQCVLNLPADKIKLVGGRKKVLFGFAS